MDRRNRIAPKIDSPPSRAASRPGRPHAASVPPPRPVRHLRTLWWWLAAAALVLAVNRAQDSHADRVEPVAAEQSGAEHEAFVAFAIERVGDGHPDAISAPDLRAQLERLQASGAQFVGLEQVRAFYETGEPLPSKPVLLVLSEARRQAVEALDPILAELGLRAVVLVNVEAVEQGNLELVSRRHLGQITASGRWQAGLNACTGTTGVAESDAEYRGRLGALEGWSRQPVLAVSCLRGWNDTDETRTAWAQTLKALSVPIGFVGSSPAVNRADDAPLALRLIPTGSGDNEPDALVRRRIAYTPRHDGVVDDFSSGRIASAWVSNQRRARVQDGQLHLSAGAGDPDGVLALGGTERWRDTEIKVELAQRPTGQFWIYARRKGPAHFVRLGIAGNDVVLQRTDPDGQTRQVGVAPLPPGAMSMTLRVVGSRAIALVDGRPLLDRPAELPAELTQGLVALVAWNTDDAARAILRRVEVQPLPRRLALLRPSPDDAEFARLLRDADNLWALSPRLFRWRGERGYATDEPAASVSIFAGHQRIAMLPAVVVERLPSDKNWDAFRERLLQWAQHPSYAGLNLVLDRLRPEDFERIGELHQVLANHGRELAVTVQGPAPELASAPAFMLFADNGSGPLAVASVRSPRHPG